MLRARMHGLTWHVSADRARSSRARGRRCSTWATSARARSPAPLRDADRARSGYLASCREIVATAKAIEKAVREEMPELYVLGKPVASVVAFGSVDESTLSALAIGDLMSARGWHLNALMNPPAVHIACTVRAIAAASDG